MLNYNKDSKPNRKDRPWLLFILAAIWIAGTVLFHDPWEPYEPFVVAVVKNIVITDSWFVPYISNSPYVDIQPFYFWLYAAFIKLFNFHDIANAVRVINTVIILSIVILCGKIGSRLSAYKNGRSTVLILISSIGFINNAYQISPNIIVLLGFCLYIFALQLHSEMPGISSGILAAGLTFISIHFTAEFIVIALLVLAILPCISRLWRSQNYFISSGIGISIFFIIFYSYAWQLKDINYEFYSRWEHHYIKFIEIDKYKFFAQFTFYLQTLAWYLIPSWILVMWTIYKRRTKIFKDRVLQLSVVLIFLLFTFALISGVRDESAIFPIVLAFIFISSVEIDSIRISIVAFLNWFCIILFGLVGLSVWFIYIAFNLASPLDFLTQLQSYSPEYVYKFNIIQLILALIVTVIWLFMVTRKHIRGREMVTNWASGTTFFITLFMSLCLPFFNSILSFQPMVTQSLKYIPPGINCIATNETNKLQSAIWYYYAGIKLISVKNLDDSVCQEAIVASYPDSQIHLLNNWRVIWSAKRSVDTKTYILLKRIN